MRTKCNRSIKERERWSTRLANSQENSSLLMGQRSADAQAGGRPMEKKKAVIEKI
jgi:hypothetical protein